MKAWKWQLAIALVVVFVAGVAIGLFAGARHAHSVFLGRHSGQAGERMKRHLQRELKLTPEQAAQIAPIVERTATQLRTIRKETGQRVAETFNQSHTEIVPILNPEQRTRLEEMKRRRSRMMHEEDGPPPDAP